MQNKLKSRKFIVWVVATIFYAIILALGFIVKDSKLALEFTSYWGFISMLYLGGNVTQKFLLKDNK
jgi:hypothetical protein